MAKMDWFVTSTLMSHKHLLRRLDRSEYRSTKCCSSVYVMKIVLMHFGVERVSSTATHQLHGKGTCSVLKCVAVWLNKLYFHHINLDLALGFALFLYYVV